jgi:predicted N-acetyltransferase YhbS
MSQSPSLAPARTSLTLRGGSIGDAPAAGSICYRAFKAIAEQHAFPPDYPTSEAGQALLAALFRRLDVFSVVAEADGCVVGSNFLWENSMIAGVGPLTVEPSAQNAGIGRRLMLAVMERARLRGFAGVRLVQAAYHLRALSLYNRLGFEAREPLSVLQGPPLRCSFEGYRVRRVQEADLGTCAALCRRVHGLDRDRELTSAVALGTATLVERHSRITAYASDVGFYGHAVAESNDDLKALIAAAPAFTGPGFIVPSRNGALLRWCLDNGLRMVQPLTLMSLGLYQEPSGAFLPSILF